MRSLSLAIVEDDLGVRDCLVAFIDSLKGIDCQAVFESGEEAVARLIECPVDVALVDIGLPGIDGIQVIRQLKSQNGKMKIVMLTVYEDDDKIFAALQAGADGYILKRSSPSEILLAVKEVYEGGAPMSGIIARKVIQHFRTPDASREDDELDSLSKREMEILELLAKGDLYKEIAKKLSVGYETVHTHIRRIYEKLHVRSRTQAVSKLLNRK